MVVLIDWGCIAKRTNSLISHFIVTGLLLEFVSLELSMKYFAADHPFHFILLESTNKVFEGRLVNIPESS